MLTPNGPSVPVPGPSPAPGGASTTTITDWQNYAASLPSAAPGPTGTASRNVDWTDPTTWGGVKLYVGQGFGLGPNGQEHTHPQLDMRGYNKEESWRAEFNRWNRLSVKQKHDWALRLALGGFVSSVPNIENAAEWAVQATEQEVDDAFTKLVGAAAQAYNDFGQRTTVEGALANQIAYRLGGTDIKWNGDLNKITLDKFPDMVKGSVLGGSGSGSGSTKKPDLSGTFTQTSTSNAIDYIDPMDAKYLVRGTLQRELGRDPTQAEYEDFLASLHAAEAHDPSVSKTTMSQTTNKVGRVTDQSTNTVTHGGMTESGLSQLMTERARSQPGWAEWQAMGTYAPALFNALGAAVPGT